MVRKDQYMLKVVDMLRHCYVISCSDSIFGRRHLKGKGLPTEGSMVQSITAGKTKCWELESAVTLHL